MLTTDLGGGGLPEPDAHGRAALLLVEALIHSMTAHSLLSVAEAVEVMEDAREVQIAMIKDADPPTLAMTRAAALLNALAESMKIDLPKTEAPDAADG